MAKSKKLKYYVLPIVEKYSTNYPLFPEAVPLEDAIKQITGRMPGLEQQGHWRDDRGQKVPLTDLGFHILTEQEWEEIQNT